MSIQKATTKPNGSPKQPGAENLAPSNGRRSFIWKTGAAMSALLATAAAGVSKPKADQEEDLKAQIDRLSNQVRSLKDANSIRRLHQAYESYLDKGMYEEIVNMFADEGEVVFNGGLFVGKNRGIRRLYCNHFSSCFIGRKIEPAPGFELDPAQYQDVVEVAPDRKSAKARFPYSIQVGRPLSSDSQLMAMARLQGQGIMYWWEGGTYEVSYVKNAESWKIKRLDYQVISKADYKPGRSYATPIDVPLFSKTHPENPTGPDKLVNSTP